MSRAADAPGLGDDGALPRRRARQSFDFVLLDCPPLETVADSVGARRSLLDGLLLVVRARHASRARIRQALSRLEPGAVRGVVFNDRTEILARWLDRRRPRPAALSRLEHGPPCPTRAASSWSWCESGAAPARPAWPRRYWRGRGRRSRLPRRSSSGPSCASRSCSSGCTTASSTTTVPCAAARSSSCASASRTRPGPWSWRFVYYLVPASVRVARRRCSLGLPLSAAAIVAWHAVHRWTADREALSDNVLIVGSGPPPGRSRAEMLRRAPLGYRVVGFLGHAPRGDGPAARSIPRSSGRWPTCCPSSTRCA